MTGESRILYQRGVYPPEDFKQVKKYGLTLFTSADEALEGYVRGVMKQVQSALTLFFLSFPSSLKGACTRAVFRHSRLYLLSGSVEKCVDCRLV